ncbi:30S ribosomal protein S3 [Candidatus Kaiserbacteria bacterium CG10_big_fil_rev_8_21_14_0_10_45_20]|uniref:Small ribosomal subunit protein uS3 n=1 Tax=Candidatus Kaiserbacteria bacterium CG10_big_fil_rev_8_21_14_0_10_45_20 TaxID=1974607 RepID=A0A2H0UFG4_9BACT|nr:MAG: 30S ribosomal protein S3 [Candidatus Kaiserbacteria bacterium CG10_big_fil_rev_8_21_14_0_10_45_20]
MTHTVHPYSHRLGILRDWKSRWFTADPKKYRQYVRADATIREFLAKRLKGNYVSHIEIERSQKDLRISVHTARPGMVIGRSGENAIKIKSELANLLKKVSPLDTAQLHFDIIEIRSPESNAAVVAAMVIEGLEKRFPFRRVMKQTMDKVMANRDVQGVKISLSGMLGGASMSRTESLKKGRIPLQTFRADIDYAHQEARLPLGQIGVKVWIYKGDVFKDETGAQS